MENGDKKNNPNDSELSSPEIIAQLGELKPGAIITESGLAKMFNRHVVSVKRAISRGEFPQPVRIFGQPSWTVRVLIEFIEKRLREAEKDAERERERLEKLHV